MAKKVERESLFRNVPRGHFDPDANEPTPAALWPTKEDNGFLSSDRSSVWTAEDSHRHRTEILRRGSRGVISMDADELAKSWGISTVEDPLEAGVDGAIADNPAHALSDFTEHVVKDRTARKAMREQLLDHALTRGWDLGPFSS